MGPVLDWIEAQQGQMVALVKSWAAINSHADNLAGLEAQLQSLKAAFGTLPALASELQLEPQKRLNREGDLSSRPLGRVLRLMRSAGEKSVLLVGHMDTIYPADGPFQSCCQIDPQRLQGPGVADMKAGLVILLIALQALERSPWAGKLGWEVLITPDEEVGSMGSRPIVQESAHRHQFGFVFEPALPDGCFVSQRPGSSTYQLTARGRAAHAGRDFAKGQNAILMLLPIIQQLHALNAESGIILNIGALRGGDAVNRVPDYAFLQFGLRAQSQEQLAWARQRVKAIVEENILSLELAEITYRPPKLFDTKTQQLFNTVKACAERIGLPMEWRPSGGVCDGNWLAFEHLPTIDTMGAIGGNLHTDSEYLILDSLVPRAQLAALVLMQLASS